jgi:hypothetical protein
MNRTGKMLLQQADCIQSCLLLHFGESLFVCNHRDQRIWANKIH